jgi:hypothetical protein
VKDIERLVEKLSRQLCRERKMPTAMRELLFGEVYNLIYFGNKVTLKDLIRRAGAEKEYGSTL